MRENIKKYEWIGETKCERIRRKQDSKRKRVKIGKKNVKDYGKIEEWGSVGENGNGEETLKGNEKNR